MDILKSALRRFRHRRCHHDCGRIYVGIRLRTEEIPYMAIPPHQFWKSFDSHTAPRIALRTALRRIAKGEDPREFLDDAD